jgi:transposase
MTRITRSPAVSSTPVLMALISRVGVDLAKNVIQVHAVDKAGRVLVAKALKRTAFVGWCAQLPAGCVVAMEACSGAHAWGRRLRALGLGLEPKLIAPNFVSPYRMEGKTGKNDMTDAAAVCEAASRPSMRFVPIKSAEQQSVMVLHALREGFKAQRVATINRIRSALTEFEVVVGKSPKVLRAAQTKSGRALCGFDQVGLRYFGASCDGQFVAETPSWRASSLRPSDGMTARSA